MLAATAICLAIFPFFERTNLVMVYLLGTLAVATRGRRGPAAAATVLSILCFDFFFVPPRFTFNVNDVQYIWTFFVMFAVAMIISHLTIRLREEAEAARLGHERAETERLRSALLSSVSHDLRTPLAAIVGSASALGERQEFRDPTSRELLENIQNEGGRLSQLVSNLLEATRFESGTVQLRKEKYPFEEILGNALDRLEKALKDHGVFLDIPQDLPLIPMDGLLIEQVLINLIENALRYAPLRSRVEISARAFLRNPAPSMLHESTESTTPAWGQDPRYVMVTIADQGIGLKEEELERVFDKFYHDARSPGAGLGLAICRGVIKAHGGQIWASNRPEGGAVFSFTLPL